MHILWYAFCHFIQKSISIEEDGADVSEEDDDEDDKTKKEKKDKDKKKKKKKVRPIYI
jgi:hypothetical protein